MVLGGGSGHEAVDGSVVSMVVSLAEHNGIGG
jgi:hypothetical protein